jgi:hypothetical protein
MDGATGLPGDFGRIGPGPHTHDSRASYTLQAARLYGSRHPEAAGLAVLPPEHQTEIVGWHRNPLDEIEIINTCETNHRLKASDT